MNVVILVDVAILLGHVIFENLVDLMGNSDTFYDFVESCNFC